MRASFHRFLLFCLMLALPLQGFAAATMLSCALGAWQRAGGGRGRAVLSH